jgi:hypothetical protein
LLSVERYEVWRAGLTSAKTIWFWEWSWLPGVAEVKESERKPTPNVVFKMSLRLSSFRYSNESSGISTSRVPTLSHVHSAAKKRKVANNLGLEEYHGLLFLAASKVVPPFGDINPKVSMEIRRILTCSYAATESEKKTWRIWQITQETSSEVDQRNLVLAVVPSQPCWCYFFLPPGSQPG